MIGATKIYLSPTKAQEKLMFQSAGVSRFTYNWCLNYKKTIWETEQRDVKLQELIEKSKNYANDNDLDWFFNVAEATRKRAIKDLMLAYKNFFTGLKRGEVKYPKFKSKRGKISFYQREDNLRYFKKENKLTLTGIGRVKIKHMDFFPDSIKNPRVCYDGKNWYISISTEMDEETPDLTSNILGIDLGIKELAITSDNVHYRNINKDKNVIHLKERLKRKQRRLSKKYESNKQGNKYIKTKNIIKLENEIKLIHRKLKNIRDTYIHTVTFSIVKTKPCKIVIEDLDVKRMLKNKHLSNKISEQCFYKFMQYLSYKCQYYSIELIKADRYYPSTKLCSVCGHKKTRISLSERTYTCEKCGVSIDRDFNASLNLQKYGFSH